MFWGAGAVYAAAGIVLYSEYGLSVPRRVISTERRDGTIEKKDIGVPRSGGDLHYVGLSTSLRWTE
jgi:hypothetical protein